VSEKRDSSFQQWFFLRLTVATLVVSAGIILLSLGAEHVARTALFVCLAAQYLGIGAGYVAWRSGVPRLWVQTSGLILDVTLITVLMHLTGGVGSVFTLLYFFPILLASSTQRRRGALTTAIVCSLTILGYEVLVATRVLAPPVLFFNAAPLHRRELLQVQFAVGLFLIIGYLAGELAQRVDAKARQLAAKRDELARHRLEIQGILDNMSSGVLTIDEKGRVQRLNPAAGEILGLNVDKLRGLSIENTLGPIMPTFVSHLREALRDGKAAHRVELNIMRRDTTIVPIGVSISQQYDQEGQRTGIIAVFQDLTEVLRMRARMRANDRLAAIGELSAGIAHEIRNPLASIRGCVEMLSSELAVEGENLRLMSLVLKESERLNRIIEDFLEYARLRPQAPRKVHLRVLLDDLCMMLQRRDDLGANASVELDPSDADYVVDVDEEQMSQVFLNLALNAFQAMSNGGKLRIATELRPKEQPPEVAIRFMDQGEGIDEESLAHVFDPFFTTKSEGTGLGLSMANRIVHNHEGRIEFSNLAEGGAEFAVHLPLIGVWRDGDLVATNYVFAESM
jgi:two-component system sensor histidine kinase PilS (NtrC family)